MPTVLITGAHGLVGSESVRQFCRLGFDVVGIDNDMRIQFFGPVASTRAQGERLRELFPRYRSIEADIRTLSDLERVFEEYSSSIELVIHAAAQSSQDWAAREPLTDFTVNANGTLNLLECTRKYASKAAFIFTSTNKVYGDHPNQLPLVEQEYRWEIDPSHPYHAGIDENMSLDQTAHSLSGTSKVAADLLVQEYGRCFGMNTGVFRAGRVAGPSHLGAELDGYLAYLVRCVLTNTPYTIFGYRGKQVRDNIHSHDLVSAFWHFFRSPRSGEVYNIGGGRHSNCSMLEAIALCEAIGGRTLKWTCTDEPRKGDHKWWISDAGKFQSHYPNWAYRYTLRDTMVALIDRASSQEDEAAVGAETRRLPVTA